MHCSKYDVTITALAKNIREKRISQKLTIQELAYRCEMERSNMSRIETGKINITIKTLCLIAAALRVEVAELLE